MRKTTESNEGKKDEDRNVGIYQRKGRNEHTVEVMKEKGKNTQMNE